ncbi:hypothetical protein [Pseudonocardia sp.]|uniref:hypothetical protein n=1 Tax=Pseudonocardia sp. TaxID=60912 RepID=UPI00261A9A44|nr:hypothetical protein [Pseudonocardia sp.]
MSRSPRPTSCPGPVAMAMFAVAAIVVHERTRRASPPAGVVASDPGYGGSPPP